MPRRTSLLAAQLSGKKPQTNPLLLSTPEEDPDAPALSDFRRLSTLYGSNINSVALSKSRKKALRDAQRKAELIAESNPEPVRLAPPSPVHARGRAKSTASSGRGRSNSTISQLTRGRNDSQQSQLSSAGTARFRGASDMTDRTVPATPQFSPQTNFVSGGSTFKGGESARFRGGSDMTDSRPRLETQPSSHASNFRNQANAPHTSSTASLFSNYERTSKDTWNPDRPNTADATVRRLREMKANKKQNMKEPLTSRLSRPKSTTGKFVNRDRTAMTRAEKIKQPVHDDSEVQHPWYYGYNNTSKPPSSQPFAIANRFGFRGAQALIKQTSERARHIDVEHPGNIDVEKDLGRPDEWGPTLRMEPSRSGSNLQTPGSWPAASEFPNGQPLKRPTTDYWFNRESTLGETAQQRPKSALPERLARTLEKEKTMLIQLSSTVHKERMEVTVKRPGSAPVMRHKKNIITKQPAIQQIIGNTTLNYWGEMSASVKRELQPEKARETLKRQHATQKLQSEAKWVLLREFYKCFRRGNRGIQAANPGMQDLHELANKFTLTCQENPLPNVISRNQFLSMLSTILDDAFDLRSAQKLYTCFDQKNSDRFPWVVLVAAIRCLLSTSEDTVGKLLGVFDVFERYAKGKMTVNNCYAIFILCNGSDDELHEMKMHYRHSFRMHLRDAVVKRNQGTMLDNESDGVEFAKVTSDMFQDALRSCDKICHHFQAQCSRAVERSGAKAGEGL